MAYKRRPVPTSPAELPGFLQKELERIERGFSGISSAWSDLSGVPPNVTAFGALGGAADKLAYFTGVSALALATLTPFARTILACATATAARTALGVVAAPARADTPITTASLADLASETSNVALGAFTALLVSITADRACWVRLYTSDAARLADAGRALGTIGAAGVGLLAEFLFAGAGTIPVSPVATLTNDEGPAQRRIWYVIQNRSGSAHVVTVTLTALPVEV